MSLSHPNTPVSQQDLHDFYNKIKPYMGSYPSAIVSKFKKSDLYSTDERVVGQWIDGKPLYQRTLVSNALGTHPDVYLTFTDMDKANVVEIKGVAINPTTGNSLTIPRVHDRNLAYQLAVTFTKSSGVEVYSRDTDDSYVGYIAHVTVRYTKTTDTAISIGEETDYSTDEKIVGTWIDGSPVYQKTVEITNPTVTNNEILVELLNFKVDLIIDSKFILKRNGSNGVYSNLKFYESDSDKATVFVAQTTGNPYFFMRSNYSDLVKLYVTLQYTKSTT